LGLILGALLTKSYWRTQDGKPELIQAASTSLQGPHGQWIENIHLLPYENEEEFFTKLYPRYQRLIDRASDFLEAEGNGEEVLVFIRSVFTSFTDPQTLIRQPVPVSMPRSMSILTCPGMAERFQRLSTIDLPRTSQALQQSTPDLV
jgi:hypothetical protein